ncbi:MAG: DUF3786 domain-containing protein [Planctomycetota bacterium]|jgi:hypothetical protein
MHEGLWQKFESLDQMKALQRAKCFRLNNTTECCVITLLNKPYTIDLKKRDIFLIHTDSQQVKAGFLEQLCILAYLIHSKDLLPTNRLLKAQSLPGGEFFFRGHHSLPTDKLEDVFGKNPENLYPASMPLGAKKCDFGDASVELLVLPRVPLTFVIWAGDDEFDARASILFDSTASEQIPLDALHAAVHLAVNAATKQDITSL